MTTHHSKLLISAPKSNSKLFTKSKLLCCIGYQISTSKFKNNHLKRRFISISWKTGHYPLIYIKKSKITNNPEEIKQNFRHFDELQ